ncbi:MAG: caspase family protein, partial [Cyanobacteria bacterium J06559_3]
MARNWALVVGINNYNPLNFTPLKYAKRDAERVSEFFQAAGFEVRCFTDDSPPLTLPSGHTIPTQPTYGNLITFLQDRFESEFLTTGDNCWFFFAGHGERHQDRDYLMPIDANSRGAEVIAGLTINYVQERLSRCGADNVIMMLDACRSEGSRDGGGIRAETQKGLITIASCQPTQKSWELDELQQGAFTYALLEALQLPGEQSCATVERLSAYLNRRVPALCQQYGIPANKIPTPRISADPIEKQHFILIPQYARQADLDLLKLDAYRLQRSNPILAEQICIRLNALALGRDLEVFELLYKIRNAVRSHPNLPEDNRPDEAVPRSPNTAVTTTISDQLEKNRETPEPALNSEL